jgi:hypothetical protein
MWYQKESGFLYFFCKRNVCINNNTLSSVFKNTFKVEDEDKLCWASSGNSLRLSPETLTYWSEK